MSDQRLRDLERRWRQTGAIEDEAAYLLERLRTGGLSRENVRLAAVCGHTAAAIAMSLPLTDPPIDDHWILHRIVGSRAEVNIRVALSGATIAITKLQGLYADNVCREHRHDLALAMEVFLQAWPEPEKNWFARQGQRLAGTVRRMLGKEAPIEHLRRVAQELLERPPVLTPLDPSLRYVIAHAIRCSLERSAVMTQAEAGCALHPTLRWLAPSLCRDIAEDLIAWSLGNDPLPAQILALRSRPSSS